MEMANYGDSDELEEILLKQFREEEKAGRMVVLSEGEARKRFPADQLRIAAQGAIPKRDGSHREGKKDGEAQTDIRLVGPERTHDVSRRKEFSKEGRYKERINQSTKERLAMEKEDRLLLAKRAKVISWGTRPSSSTIVWKARGRKIWPQ